MRGRRWCALVGMDSCCGVDEETGGHALASDKNIRVSVHCERAEGDEEGQDWGAGFDVGRERASVLRHLVDVSEPVFGCAYSVSPSHGSTVAGTGAYVIIKQSETAQALPSARHNDTHSEGRSEGQGESRPETSASCRAGS